MWPDYEAIKKAKGEEQFRLHQEGVDKVKLVIDHLESHYQEEYAHSKTAFCVKHNCQCPVMKTKECSDKELTWTCAGSPCVAWSAEGHQLGVVHPSFLAFRCFVFEVRCHCKVNSLPR